MPLNVVISIRTAVPLETTTLQAVFDKSSSVVEPAEALI